MLYDKTMKTTQYFSHMAKSPKHCATVYLCNNAYWSQRTIILFSLDGTTFSKSNPLSPLGFRPDSSVKSEVKPLLRHCKYKVTKVLHKMDSDHVD